MARKTPPPLDTSTPFKLDGVPQDQTPAEDPMLARIKAALDQYKPQPVSADLPPPVLPQGPNLDVMRSTLDRANTLGMLHGAFGVRTPSTYEVMKSGSAQPQMMPSPSYDAAKARIMQPWEEEKLRAGVAGQQVPILNEYAEKKAQMGLKSQEINQRPELAEIKGMLAAMAQQPKINLQLDRMDETKRHNAATEATAEDKTLNAERTKFNTATDEWKGRANTLKAMNDQILAGERIKKLVDDGNGGIRNLSPNEMTEFGRLMDRMLAGGGSVSEGITKELTPHTAGRKLAEIQQWITNMPAGTDQQEFLRLALKTIGRETGVAKDAIRSGKQQAVSGIPYLLKKDRPYVENRLKGVGLDPNEFDLDTGLLRSGPVKIRRKKDGLTKTLAPEKAAEYLKDPGFEQVNE